MFMFINTYIHVYVCVIATERQRVGKKTVGLIGPTILFTMEKQKSSTRHNKLSSQMFGHSNTNDS